MEHVVWLFEAVRGVDKSPVVQKAPPKVVGVQMSLAFIADQPHMLANTKKCVRNMALELCDRLDEQVRR